ncbi:hypothetical protein C8Q80DRAFT_820918 [Daedaleopsis nitida]|nr:hypothetical protein C8Q80DRAFT_820918 [Daedaleopsis nitida]
MAGLFSEISRTCACTWQQRYRGQRFNRRARRGDIALTSFHVASTLGRLPTAPMSNDWCMSVRQCSPVPTCLRGYFKPSLYQPSIYRSRKEERPIPAYTRHQCSFYMPEFRESETTVQRSALCEVLIPLKCHWRIGDSIEADRRSLFGVYIPFLVPGGRIPRHYASVFGMFILAPWLLPMRSDHICATWLTWQKVLATTDGCTRIGGLGY